MTVEPTNGLPDGQNPAIPDSVTAPVQPPDTAVTTADTDAAELASALAAAEAEATGAPVAEPAAPSPSPPAATLPVAPAAPSGNQGAPSLMVPKARLDDEARRRRHAEELVGFHRAEAEALRAAAAGTTPAQPTAQPPAAPAALPAAQRIAAEREKVAEAARKYDAGEITTEDLERARYAADDAIAEIRSAPQQPQQPVPSQPGLADQFIMQQQLDALQVAHPFVAALNGPQAQLLASIARAEAQAAGKPYGQTAADTMNLRAHVAALSDLYGPRWGLPRPQGTNAPAAQPSNQQQPRPGQPARPLSPDAQARLAAMDKAAGLPPDTAAIGAAASGSDEITEARISTMSDEEINALPAAVRNRYLT